MSSVFSVEQLTKVFHPAHKDALSVLNEFVAICRAHRDFGIPSEAIDAVYSIIEVLKVIGMSKVLDLSGFVCPPFIFYSPKGLLCLNSKLGELFAKNGRGWVVESSIVGSALPLQQIVDL